ncbi:hypothetical protein [Streptomyces anulatus]|uniref:hypothetical protein n=1 Tax=Streptomyces anulatus TaxID=1892 RepID=UPI0012FE7FB6|nr:hypothetical protein [Streptomyces anulatus]
MENFRSWCDVKTPAGAEALRAEFDRRARKAAAEAQMYERMRDTVADIPRLGKLWDELVANPPDLAQVLPSTTQPTQPSAPGQQLDTEAILALMGQVPQRLWSAEDVRVAIGAPSRRDVRRALRDMAGQGLLEEIQRKARHVLFRLSTAPAQRTD